MKDETRIRLSEGQTTELHFLGPHVAVETQNHKGQEPDTAASKLTALGGTSAPRVQASSKPADTEGRVTEG